MVFKYLIIRLQRWNRALFWTTLLVQHVVFVITGIILSLDHFRGGNTPAHRGGPVTMTGLLPTRKTLPHTHTHTHTTTTQTPHALQRYKARSDNRQVYLALVSLERSKKSNADPQEGWGFFVCGVSHFIMGKTCNRPWKAFEARGRGVWEWPLWLPLMSTPILGLWAISWIRIVFVSWEGNHPRIVYPSTDELITVSL